MGATNISAHVGGRGRSASCFVRDLRHMATERVVAMACFAFNSGLLEGQLDGVREAFATTLPPRAAEMHSEEFVSLHAPMWVTCHRRSSSCLQAREPAMRKWKGNGRRQTFKFAAILKFVFLVRVAWALFHL